ncbi:MAG: hypothetical protein ACI9JZ_001745, partial [Lentimonas sp.]
KPFMRETTQIYTHVMKKPLGVVSPLDRLWSWSCE